MEEQKDTAAKEEVELPTPLEVGSAIIQNVQAAIARDVLRNPPILGPAETVAAITDFVERGKLAPLYRSSGDYTSAYPSQLTASNTQPDRHREYGLFEAAIERVAREKAARPQRTPEEEAAALRVLVDGLGQKPLFNAEKIAMLAAPVDLEKREAELANMFADEPPKFEPVEDAVMKGTETTLDKMRYILTNPNGTKYEVTRKMMQPSLLFVDMTKEDSIGDDKDGPLTIPLIEVGDYALEKIVAFLRYHENDPPAPIELPLKSALFSDHVCPFDLELITTMNQDQLVTVVLAANYMDIPSLLDIACAFLACEVHDKTPAETKDYFSIDPDITPDEEKKVREDHGWIFEVGTFSPT